MVNNNDLINLVNIKKPVELVQELKDYEIKKSPLSLAARSKVINKSGGNYVSENKGGYGPCSSCGRSDHIFKLEFTMTNKGGYGLGDRFYSPEQALSETTDIL